MILRPTGLWMLFAASNVLFPLMTLFLWLDFSRYEAYVPLYLVGKSVSVFSLLGWSAISLINGTTIWMESRIIEGFFLCGDLLAVAAILIIFKNTQAAAVTEREIATDAVEGE